LFLDARQVIEKMNIGIGLWELFVVLFYIVIMAIPVIFIIWLVKTMGRIEKSLGRIEAKLEQLAQR
jgi:hypothetical protein